MFPPLYIQQVPGHGAGGGRTRDRQKSQKAAVRKTKAPHTSGPQNNDTMTPRHKSMKSSGRGEKDLPHF